MNVLIVDDEKDMLKILKAYFEREGYSVFLAEDGEQALDLFYSNKIDLVVLDWMMPHVSGLSICKEIKKNSHVKVLMLTAKSEDEDELLALNMGADDYIKKPFHPGVLLMRAKKLMQEDKVAYLGDIKIDFQAKKIYRSEQDVQATKKELDLVSCFLRNKGKILTRKDLLDLVWGMDYVGDERTVDTHVRRLREKIGSNLIKTHRGLGYSLENVDE
ncbi:response regulator transcription factor [Thermoactinomyces sp. DSM 45892]|uniref:response regulator transcription factor n=1 Tax=Thermoactinomyces sp. DSM 45892 TaxID=1882753 RepID=UPI00089D45DB|nr:response regulator transcription factor [Thermoactinomyces sp. DSM 45892]SDZ35007.1 DNA-binding response regulator, OmpR family, contains REC and winged-helix (wHTH) domain [Thermoactinomyces sp. DSM 45892]